MIVSGSQKNIFSSFKLLVSLIVTGAFNRLACQDDFYDLFGASLPEMEVNNFRAGTDHPQDGQQ